MTEGEADDRERDAHGRDESNSAGQQAQRVVSAPGVTPNTLVHHQDRAGQQRRRRDDVRCRDQLRARKAAQCLLNDRGICDCSLQCVSGGGVRGCAHECSRTRQEEEDRRHRKRALCHSCTAGCAAGAKPAGAASHASRGKKKRARE